MRISFVFAAAIAWAAVPLATTAIGTATVASTTVLLSDAAEAGTAILPGWRHPCGRQPRCFERAEARRQARLNALYMRY
jgi:hypothetical protein